MVKNSDIRILIADDEASVRDSLKSWFEEEGYQVDVAGSGKESSRKAHPTAMGYLFAGY